MLKTRDLTAGERLAVQRLRLGLCKVDMAEQLGATLYRYNRWEGDKDHPDDVPRVVLHGLRDREAAVVLRMRSGLSKAAVAKRGGFSVEWLKRMERGDAPPDRLIRFWSRTRR